MSFLTSLLAAFGFVAQSNPVQAPPSVPAPAAPFVFGVYPGGGAGTVGKAPRVRPGTDGQTLGALERLRGGRPFVLHLYAGYGGAGGRSAAAQVRDQLAGYGDAGFQTELVLTYHPAHRGLASDVGGFAAFARDAVRELGHEPGFVSLQVTNEANMAGSASASDGSYRHAEAALVAGIMAARSEIAAEGLGLKLGFNWAYDLRPKQSRFWKYLRRHGGAQFVSALNWIGLDVYPGTWGPRLGRGSLPRATAQYMGSAIRALRTRYMPLAGVPTSVPIQVCEAGYPTGAGRGDDRQATMLQAMVTAVFADRSTYNVTGFRWFDLRDSNSASRSVQAHYGLLRDDYVAKPAFWRYQQLVAALTQ